MGEGGAMGARSDTFQEHVNPTQMSVLSLIASLVMLTFLFWILTVTVT